MTIIVVGSCNLDLIVEVAAHPAPGETVLGSDVVVRPGGKGANQAVAAARLGASVTFVGAVGPDEFGATLRAWLAENGLDLSHVQELDGPTGVALIVVDQAGENSITVAAGANGRLALQHLDGIADRLDADALLLTQLEIPLATCVGAAERVRRSGGRVITNAAPLRDADDPRLRTLLSHTDVLVVNEPEALALAGGRSSADWGDLAGGLRRFGPAVVVVTLGSAGAVIADGDGVLTVPAPAVRAIDTTGAGDAFCGALAAGLAAGQPIRTAVERACAAGALATTAVGAQAALPTAEELDDFVADAWR